MFDINTGASECSEPLLTKGAHHRFYPWRSEMGTTAQPGKTIVFCGVIGVVKFERDRLQPGREYLRKYVTGCDSGKYRIRWFWSWSIQGTKSQDFSFSVALIWNQSLSLYGSAIITCWSTPSKYCPVRSADIVSELIAK